MALADFRSIVPDLDRLFVCDAPQAVGVGAQTFLPPPRFHHSDGSVDDLRRQNIESRELENSPLATRGRSPEVRRWVKLRYETDVVLVEEELLAYKLKQD
jgi:hypothetical protein